MKLNLPDLINLTGRDLKLIVHEMSCNYTTDEKASVYFSTSGEIEYGNDEGDLDIDFKRMKIVDFKIEDLDAPVEDTYYILPPAEAVIARYVYGRKDILTVLYNNTLGYFADDIPTGFEDIETVEELKEKIERLEKENKSLMQDLENALVEIDELKS